MTADIRFTSAARRQLLEAVAALRGADRNRAAAFVDEVEARLEAVADSQETVREVRVPIAADDERDFRLIYRVRGEVVWVVAVFEPGPCYPWEKDV